MGRGTTHLVGLDVGTTFCKAVVIDADGVERAHARRATPWTLVPTGAEASPDDVADAALAAVHEALAGVEGQVAAVGGPGTGMFDVVEGRWWNEALAWSGAPAGLLPEPVLAGTAAGRAGDAVRAARGAVLTVAGHDHLVAAVGAGAVEAGDVLDDCGTS